MFAAVASLDCPFGWMNKDASEELRANLEIVLAAVANDGTALAEYA